MGIYIVWNGELNSKLMFKLPSTGYVVKGEVEKLQKLSNVSFGIPLYARIQSSLGRLSLYDFYFSYEGFTYEVDYYGIHVEKPDELCFKPLLSQDTSINLDDMFLVSYSSNTVKPTSATYLFDSSFTYKLSNSSYIFNMNSFFTLTNLLFSSSFKNSSFSQSFNYSSYAVGLSSFGLCTNHFYGSFQNGFNCLYSDNPSSSNDEQDINYMYKIYSKYFYELSERFGIGFSGYGLDLI